MTSTHEPFRRFRRVLSLDEAAQEFGAAHPKVDAGRRQWALCKVRVAARAAEEYRAEGDEPRAKLQQEELHRLLVAWQDRHGTSIPPRCYAIEPMQPGKEFQ